MWALKLRGLFQNVEDANKFYKEKTKELGTNLKDLESILKQKSDNLRIIEDGRHNFCYVQSLLADAEYVVLRQKVAQGDTPQSSSAG